MRRLEKRIFRLADEITRLGEEIRLAEEELAMLRHIDDDARRDAAVTRSPIDRDDARVTGQDVARFERHLMELRNRRAELERRRQALVERLGF
jgi:chromosome segregation ATPase